MVKQRAASVWSVFFSLLVLCDIPSLASAQDVSGNEFVDWRGFGLGEEISEIFCPKKPPLRKFLDLALDGSDFSMEKMYVFATLAKQAYDAAGAENNLRNEGFDEIYQIQNSKTSFSAFLARKGNHSVLAISGTYGLQDALQDLKFSTVPDSKNLISGLVHQGFEEAIDSVWPLTLSILSQPSFLGNKIHVTGHSLGAATGTLAAARLAALGYNVADVYAFASPRVGNSTFAAWYDNLIGDRTYRFIRGVDVVPRVPPDPIDAGEFASLFPAGRVEKLRALVEKFSYKHIGKLFEFEQNADSTAPEWPSGTDMGYWLWLRRQISATHPLLSLILSRDAALHHIPDAFVCYSAKKLK